jgi:hypothetical protein
MIFALGRPLVGLKFSMKNGIPFDWCFFAVVIEHTVSKA